MDVFSSAVALPHDLQANELNASAEAADSFSPAG
jgi:hypothetical protein